MASPGTPSNSSSSSPIPQQQPQQHQQLQQQLGQNHQQHGHQQLQSDGQLGCTMGLGSMGGEDMWRGTSIAQLRRRALEHNSMSVFR